MHIHDEIDMTVEVFVVVADRVLLRKHEKYGIWLSVGGHQELNEDPNQAALREVKEEVGLDITLDASGTTCPSTDGYLELIPPTFMNRHRINDGHEHVTLVYFATGQTQKLAPPAGPEGIAECVWFTLAQLDEAEDISEHTKQYAKAALEKLGCN